LVALREFKQGRSGLATNAALDRMFGLAQEALKLAPDSSDAQEVVANVYLHRRQFDQAIELLTTTIGTSADDVGLHQALGDVYIYAGNAPLGLDQLDNLVRLDPFHDQSIYAIYGRGYLLTKHEGKAIQNVELCTARAPEYRACFDTAAVAYAEAGRLADAEVALARSQTLDPHLSLAILPEILPFQKPADLQRFQSGLSAAGLR
jgi:predicted Zn-dependent protease